MLIEASSCVFGSLCRCKEVVMSPFPVCTPSYYTSRYRVHIYLTTSVYLYMQRTPKPLRSSSNAPSLKHPPIHPQKHP